MKQHQELFDALADVFIDSYEAQELLHIDRMFRTQLLTHRLASVRDPLSKALITVHAPTEDGRHCILCVVPFPCVTVKLIDQHSQHRDDGLAGSGHR